MYNGISRALSKEAKINLRLSEARAVRDPDVLEMVLHGVDVKMDKLRAERQGLWRAMADPDLSGSTLADMGRRVREITRLLNGHAADLASSDWTPRELRDRWPAMLTGGGGLSEERRWAVVDLQVARKEHLSQV